MKTQVKKLLSLFLVMTIVLSLVVVQASATSAPATIMTAEELAMLAVEVNDGDDKAGMTYTLGADIDLSTIPDWAPIGDEIHAFAGIFDGAGHSISGMNVNTNAGYAGLFGYNKGTIKDFALSGAITSTTSKNYVGGVAGYNGGMISDVSSSVTVSAGSAYNVGGIAGFNDGGKNANISTTEDTGNNGQIQNCLVAGNVTGGTKVGGICGENSGRVQCCAVTSMVDGTVTSSKNGVGGIVGRNGNNNTACETGVIDSCYFIGTVGRAGQRWVGGIAGFSSGKYSNANAVASSITNCYMAGTLVLGAGNNNAICGLPDDNAAKAAITNNYSLNTVTNKGNSAPEIGIIKTADEMKSDAFVTALGDAFQTSCGYPVLKWQQPVAHTEKIDAGKAATCTEAGLTEGKHCSVCNEVLVKQEEIKATGHTLTHHDAVAPGCKTDGNVEYWSCSACDKNFSDASATATIDNVSIRGTGHKWTEAAYTWTKTDDGYTCVGSTYCANEGCTNYPQSNPMTEEGTVTYAVVTPAGCESEGVGRYTATFTNNKIPTTTKDVAIPATGHTEAADEAVAPTCTEAGLTEGGHCSICGKVFAEQNVVDALGHSFKDGKCSVCGTADPNAKPIDDNMPADNSKPADTAKPADNSKPETGDTGIAVWMALMAVCGGAFVGAAVYEKKKKNS